jgi:hypothetical protein
MNIIVVDGFKMISESEGEILLVESDRLQEYLDYAVKKNLQRISLQGFHGFNIVQTDFFEKYNLFTFVWIVSYIEEIDISGIRYLSNLKCLRVNNKNQGINFGYFPNLEYASLDWNKKLVNLDTRKKLGRLELWKLNPTSHTLTEFCGLTELKSLALSQSTIHSVDGIESLTNLTEFEGNYLTKLENADSFAARSESLNSLSLSNCKRLRNYAFLPKLIKLKKLKLVDCGTLPNLDFIASLSELEYLTFVGTNVENGDLAILAEKKIKFVSFDDKKHYSHKMKQINPNFTWEAK